MGRQGGAALRFSLAKTAGCVRAQADAWLLYGCSAETEMRAGPMEPPWGLMDTRPGVTAIRAGAIFSPCMQTQPIKHKHCKT